MAILTRVTQVDHCYTARKTWLVPTWVTGVGTNSSLMLRNEVD